MDFSRIAEYLKNKNISVKDFAPKHADMTADGLRYTLRKGTLKVSTLESISKGLGVPVEYWFSELKTEVNESPGIYGDNLSKEITRLRRLIDDLVDDKARLKREVDELREKAGLGKVRNSA